MIKHLLNNPIIYRWWQLPFIEKKFATVLKFNDINNIQKVLDIGCGPGVNAKYFVKSDYVGLDINPCYVEFARQNYKGRFEVADVISYNITKLGNFDLILMNSLLHHLNEKAVYNILSKSHSVLSKKGYIHILDLVMPETKNVAWILSRLDRGDYPRSLSIWEKTFSQFFEPIEFFPYQVKWFGLPLWNMIYFKGKKRK